jgi:hypothetical protein
LRLRLKPGVVYISIPYHIEAYIDLPPGFNMDAQKEDSQDSRQEPRSWREALPYEEEEKNQNRGEKYFS